MINKKKNKGSCIVYLSLSLFYFDNFNLSLS